MLKLSGIVTRETEETAVTERVMLGPLLLVKVPETE